VKSEGTRKGREKGAPNQKGLYLTRSLPLELIAVRWAGNKGKKKRKRKGQTSAGDPVMETPLLSFELQGRKKVKRRGKAKKEKLRNFHRGGVQARNGLRPSLGHDGWGEESRSQKGINR